MLALTQGSSGASSVKLWQLIPTARGFQEDAAGFWWSDPWKFKGWFLATPFPWPVGSVPADNQLLLQEIQLMWPMVFKGLREKAVSMPRAPRPVIYCRASPGVALGNRSGMTLAVVGVSCSLLDPTLSKPNHQVNPGSSLAANPVIHAQCIISPFAALQP